MTSVPHPDGAVRSVCCAVITVSDTRTQETDQSGQLLLQLLHAAGHRVEVYEIIPDLPQLIQQRLQALQEESSERPPVQVVIFNGGTGIAPRDTTYDAIATLLDKQLPGFGELFRWLSYQEIGSRAIASRAIAGTVGQCLVFSVPGSTKAVKLATEQLILPELIHLTGQLGV
jgi:molybdopterin adenylyltransferase